MTTYRIQVNTYGDSIGVFTGNAKTYSSKTEAIEAAKDLFFRWTAVRQWRVIHNESGGEIIDATGPE